MDRLHIDQLPRDLYRAEQVRALDNIAIKEHGIPGFTLMRRAAKAAFEVLLKCYPETEKITVFCGTGNNGGDGYAMASIAKQQGIDVEVIQCGDAEKISGDALQARCLAEQDGAIITPYQPDTVIQLGIIIDAILGTGLAGDVRGDAAVVIDTINAAEMPVLSIDIPSGLCSDSGRVLGKTVYADHTVSFIGLKQGLFTAAGPGYTGIVHFDDLSVPADVFSRFAASSEKLALGTLKASWEPRKATAHKGKFGHVMVTGGDSGMAGAAAMASQAALRVGAGLTSCATRPEHIPAIISRCPEVMVHGVTSGQELEFLLDMPSVIVIGPGLGQRPWGEQLLQKVLIQDCPLVVDADALNIIAAGKLGNRVSRENWILTPHPGEAARLLGCSTTEIEQDRFFAVTTLQEKYGGAVILKGAGTLIADSDHSIPALCAYGNPGMATGGMGDILSGVLGGLMAQGHTPSQAARLGVCLHASAGDLAAADGVRGMAATDLIQHLRALVN